MLVSYYYNPKNPEGLPHNKEEYGEPSPLKQMDLKKMLANCTQIGEGVSKHGAGQIYAFVADKFYTKETIVEEVIQTDGVCLCDVDELTDDERENIWSHWDELRIALPNLQTIWQSYSGNFHVCFWTENLNADEYYEQELLGLIYFAVAVKKICGITLTDKSSREKPHLDTHNSSISQRFFLNRITQETVLWNDDAIPMNFKKLSKEEREECYKYWHFIINYLEKSKQSVTVHLNKHVDYSLDEVDWLINGTEVEKIEYLPHRSRWNVYTCLAELLKDYQATEEEWRRFALRIPETTAHDYQFYIDEPNRKNHWWTDRHPYPNFSALEKYGYSIKKKESENEKLCIKKGHWLIEYKEDILNFIEENQRSEIVAPTGVGKTTFINRDINDDEVFDAEFSLAEELNSIVLVPFNVTNKLYYNLYEVNSSFDGEIKKNRQYVMVWDQALKHWNDIKDRTLIIDEAHCLFLDRTYRDVAVKLMKKIKEDNCKIVLFTATPSGEGEELDCSMKVFTNEREVININFLKVNSVDRAQLGAIKKCLQNDSIDRIVLFDDMHAKKIYENLMIEGEYVNDISYIRADTKDSDDFTYLREKELLNKKLTICTCVAFNGLNFKNDNENVVVITSYRNGDTTAAKLIQESGRIRKSKVTVIVYYDGKEFESTLEDRIDKAEVMASSDIDDALLSYDRRLLDTDTQEALRRIENKLLQDSDLNVIIKTLVDTGYFIVTEKDFQSDDYEKGDRLSLAIKKKCSEEFIEDLMNDSFGEYSPNSYKDRWKRKIDSIINNNGYTGITIDTFKELINKKNGNTLIETVISKVERIIKVSLISDSEWNNYINKIDDLKNKLKREVDKRDLANSFKQNTEIRKKYKDKVKVNENDLIDFTGIVGDLFEELEKARTEEHEKRKKVKQKEVKDIETGLMFDSMSSAAAYFNVRQSVITKWKKKGRIIQV